MENWSKKLESRIENEFIFKFEMENWRSKIENEINLEKKLEIQNWKRELSLEDWTWNRNFNEPTSSFKYCL